MIELEGVLEQGAVVGQGIAAFKGCGAIAVLSEGRRMDPAPVTKCTLRLRLDHLPVEADAYSGSFTYPWRKSSQTVDFEYLCISTPLLSECREN